MFCRECGQPVSEKARFCVSCGAPTSHVRVEKPAGPRAPDDTVIMKARGVNGEMQLCEDRVRIIRKGFMSFLTQGLKGDKDILLSHISSVQFKTADMLTNGYIQLAFVGGREAKRGILQATRDENTVMFTMDDQPAFERLNSAIKERTGMAREVKESKPSSGVDDLDKLASLRDKGIITEDEFQQKKKQILGL